MSFEEWFAQAQDDLTAAKVLLQESQFPQAVWFAEQAVEKAYKSLLFALGVRASEKVLKAYGHGVEKLAEAMPVLFGTGATAAELTELSQMAEHCRYPSDATAEDGSALGLRAPCRHPTFDVAAAAEAIGVAERVLDWARERAVWARQGLAAMNAAATQGGQP